MAPSTSKAHAAKSRIITLKLASSLLARFAPPPPSVKEEKASAAAATAIATPRTKSAPSSSESNAAQTPDVTAPPADSTPGPVTDADSNAANTPTASGNGLLAPPPPNPARRKGIPGPKPGMKRTASQLEVSGVPKPRGKPGPKKKPRLGENGEVINGAVPTAPKLGPKANQGAINACLRALDLTGKPSRRWEKKPFTVKSFTGYQWGSGSYASPKRPEVFPGDVKSDSSSAGDAKPAQDSSVVASEKSSSGANADTPVPAIGAASSPAPAALVDPSA